MQEREQLLAKCLEKDQEAFKLLYEAYAPKVYNLVCRTLGSLEEAEDLTQEVFLKVYEHLVDFKGQSKFSTWLYRVALNTCLEYRRRQRGWRIAYLNDRGVRRKIEKETGSCSVTETDRAWIREELQRALDKLPMKYKIVLILKEIEGLSYSEIAEVIGSTPGTVASRLNRARKLVEKHLRRSL